MSTADSELKARHRAMWASGDYPAMVETFLLPLGPRLVEACGIGAGHARARRRRRHRQRLDPGRAARRPGDGQRPDARAARGRPRAARRQQGVELEWVEADAENLPFDDESFDVVMSSIGAMFAPHHQDVADELVRVCRPGGTIGMLNWTPEGMIGALFRTMGPFAPPPPPGAQPPPLWGGEDHVRELFGDRVDFDARARRCSRSRRSSSPRDYGEHFKAHYGPTIAARNNAVEGRPRSRVRRGARPVLRRVEPRHATTRRASSRSTWSPSARACSR